MGTASLALHRTAKMPIGDLKMEGGRGGRGEGERRRPKPFSGALRRRGEEVRAAVKEGAGKFRVAAKERRKAGKVSGALRVEGAER